MVLLIESIILCAAFTLMVFVMSRKPINTLYNYPPRIRERVKSLDEYKDMFKGTEDMVKDYHDYRFHIKEFFIGEDLALVVCALAGLVVQFIL